jgi:hypothetical protein
MVARWARVRAAATVRLERRYARQLVLDIAAPVLPSDQMLRRIVPTAERTVTQVATKNNH